MSQTRHQPSSGGTQSRVESLSPERAGAISGTLRLRAEDAPPTTNNGHADADAGPSRRIRWSEDVIDNEGMGKKSSKVCCIYHKPRPIGESSSEESSSDSSSSDSDSDSDSCGGNRGQKDTSAQPASRGRSTCSHDHRKGHTKRRRPSPNAYEKMPKPKGR